ncbi:MAG: carboxypeptidase-like regulatory domain-containing protein [Planctomycetaceae bacterium]
MKVFQLYCGFLGICLLAGCGPSVETPTWPDPVPVSGAVTYGDEPLANAQVIFVPEGETVGKGGSGRTDDSGKYTVKSQSASGDLQDGLIPGKYKVVFSRMIKPDGSIWIPDPNNPVGPATVAAREELPMNYSTAAETKSQIEVTAANSSADFKLEK